MRSLSGKVLAAVLASLCALSAGCATAPVGDAGPPESASGWITKPGWSARKQLAVAAHPLAAQTGNQILSEGGSAVDAAIAMQMVLTLVEPQSSGIGGGAFLLYSDGNEVEAWDGRETAPMAANDRLFLRPDGHPLSYPEAMTGGRPVGTPGVLRMLEQVHRKHGKLPWPRLFEPAIRLADSGFQVSERLALSIARAPDLRKDPDAAAHFFDRQGKPLRAGSLLRNPALARTLRRIASEGADAFYTGEIAAAIVAKVANHRENPGLLREQDLASYRAVLREPVCGDYRKWRICGMPPPSSGGIAVLQILGMLENTDIGRFAPADGQLHPQAIHLFSEAGRLAYADRARYVADADFVPLPGGSPRALLDKRYLARRAAKIGTRSLGQAQPGMPLAGVAATGSDRSTEMPSTSHLSVVDAQGRAVAMTSSIERAFGSRVMVHGFLLNNQLTDFSLVPADRDGPIANRVEPGKRPRSAMAPTLVFERDSGDLSLVIGSPGGPSIINYVARTLVAVLDWNQNIQQAINLPNFGSRNGPTELEAGRVSPALIEALRERGHVIRVSPQTSGLHGIQRIRSADGMRWFAGADPRREGIASGE